LHVKLDFRPSPCSCFVHASTADIAREQEEGLALLFRRGLELALKIQEDAMAAESADERARLGGAFHRIARGVRQTAALRTRLAADVRRAEREDQTEVIRLDERRVARRRAQVKTTVERLIWSEAESEDAANALLDDLDTLLGEDELYGRLAEGEVETHIARLREELGLSQTALAGEGADPGGASAPEAPGDPSPAWIPAVSGPGEGREPAPVMPDHPFRSSA
jgi:hypothetical protein